MTIQGKRGRPSRRVRLEEIAARCGVSVSTASRALSGVGGVKDDLRATIIETAKSMNYAIPASVAGRKVILAASSVAMVDSARNQFTYHVLDGLNERARLLGVELVTRPVATPEDEIALLRESERDDSVAGCLFLTLDDADVLTLTAGFSKPIVLVNGDDPSMRHSSVTPCNRSAAMLAARHLIGLGHRRILFLMRRGRRTIERRYEGWRDALMAGGITGFDDLVVEVEDWLPELASKAVTARIADRGLDFTAVLTAGDSLAFGAIAGIQEAGYSVPADVSVVGMDDLPQAAFCNPPLTTMHIPMREIGSAALSLLLDDMAHSMLPPRRVELACHLVVRRSTAPAPAGAEPHPPSP
ncbi:MAG: LacI family transcriptional regulator [Mesorhizobium sp.]|uniref:LacI family DNA-binding transcriptional regulator n=1 Tax=Mesorhizobium sp. TaxID=1871066 RepID=UPI000FE81072|nr:LacI family DNA-binding transcriptional regulator [Mesorhizobium sp.]RWM07159.1 MAG: LacI family transcriptional regulator [Mesorhizobium sp.]TIO50516.1 MAG: LacI family transcriptional regulator [Mesorhizobium sp.]TIO59287.1 MAG: LacI family transcriptional regulator [Mesorhizobium sp.]TJV59802.1 MAG: LacI family transcriptional regulator [Mesorhizobium sp.]